MSPALTRREALARSAQASAVLALAGVAGGARAPAAEASDPHRVADPPLGRADYWAFADWIQPAMDHAWNQRTGHGYSSDARIDALLLGTHALAALDDHHGPARNDARARALVRRLLHSPPYVPSRKAGGTGPTSPQSATQDHSPGWRAGGPQHVAVDPKIAESLAHAWRARERLKLGAALSTRIAHHIDGTARGVFFRYPNIRLNQANWYTGLYLSAAEVTGNNNLVHGPLRAQLVRFLRGGDRKVAPWNVPNFGPSWNFHRSPFSPLQDHQNIDNAEYANIVLEIVLHERQARTRGMAPLGAHEAGVLRAYALRAIPAYWTHSGYLNWDTGLYLQRWHAGAYWAFALQGLFAVALAPPDGTGHLGGWAKWIFDRALGTYARLAADHGTRAPVNPVFPIHSAMGDHTTLFAARFQYQAARAAWFGLFRRPTIEPGPLYAYDPQIGRLAVSTPAYNTAIVAVSDNAFPYGGLDPARLYDGDQRVAANIGGVGSGAFGLTVTDGRGAVVLRSQQTRDTLPAPGHAPLDLVRSPQGHVRAGTSYPHTPYAGSFGELEVTGVRDAGSVRLRATHVFTATHIVSRWSATRRTSARRDVSAHFPSWWPTATVRAQLRSGELVVLAADGHLAAVPTPLAQVRWLYVRSGGTLGGGYVIVVRAAPRGTDVAVGRPGASSSEPQPGPTLVLRLTPRSAWRRLALEVAYAPADTIERARKIAHQLG